MSNIFLITARLKSTRLKKKIIKKINNKEIILHMIDRIKNSKYFKKNKIVVCTSFLKSDQPLVHLCKKNNINIFLGEPEDVLQRLYDAAVKYNAKHILNITADCPLVEPQYIDQIYKKLKSNKYDLIRAYDLPHGSFSYGIKRDSLKKVIEIKNSKDTEVWERYFIETGLFNVYDLKIKNKFHIRPGLRLTMDYKEDLILIRKIFNIFKNTKFFSLTDIIKLLDNNKNLLDINKKYYIKFKSHYKKKLFLNLKKNKLLNTKYPKKLSFIPACKAKIF